MRKYFSILVALTAFAVAARADIIPTLDSISPGGVHGIFFWNYTANVTANQTIEPGDFFTIYDFSSMQPTGTGAPTGWTFSNALVGPTPANVSPHDDPTLWNVTWTYTGTTPIVGAASLGTFTVVANTDQMKTGQFTGQGTRSQGQPEAGSKISNIGNVTVPIPEPSALFPIMSFCAAIGANRFLRRRKE